MKTQKEPLKLSGKMISIPIEHPAKGFIAVGPQCWGRGKTVEEAKRNCKFNLPYGYKFRCYVYLIRHEDTLVDDMGGLNFPAGFAPELIESPKNP